MIKSVVFCAAAVLFLTAILESKSLRPEIGGVVNKSWTREQDFKSLHGVGFYVIQPVSQKTYLKAASDYYTKAIKGVNGLDLYPWLYEDKLHVRNNLETVSLSIMTEIARAKTTFLYVGVGVEGGSIWQTIKGFTRTETVYRNIRSQFGVSIEASLLVNKLKGIPLVMRFGFLHRFISTDLIATSYNNSFPKSLTTTERASVLAMTLEEGGSMKRAIPILQIFAALFVLIVNYANGESQNVPEVGVLGRMTSTDSFRLSDPRASGAYGQYPLSDQTSMRFTLQWMESSRDISSNYRTIIPLNSRYQKDQILILETLITTRVAGDNRASIDLGGGLLAGHLREILTNSLGSELDGTNWHNRYGISGDLSFSLHQVGNLPVVLRATVASKFMFGEYHHYSSPPGFLGGSDYSYVTTSLDEDLSDLEIGISVGFEIGRNQ